MVLPLRLSHRRRSEKSDTSSGVTNPAAQQQALLQLLFTGAAPLPALPHGAPMATGLPFHGERGLHAYCANGLALAR